MKNDKRNSWASFDRTFVKGGRFVVDGYELSQRVRRWAKKYPAVRIVMVDDERFSTSDIVLMPEYVKGKLWGVFATFIPQNIGEPVQFFMYPNNVGGMIDALFGIVAERPKKEKP